MASSHSDSSTSPTRPSSFPFSWPPFSSLVFSFLLHIYWIRPSMDMLRVFSSGLSCLAFYLLAGAQPFSLKFYLVCLLLCPFFFLNVFVLHTPRLPWSTLPPYFSLALSASLIHSYTNSHCYA